MPPRPGPGSQHGGMNEALVIEGAEGLIEEADAGGTRAWKFDWALGIQEGGWFLQFLRVFNVQDWKVI